MSLEAKMLDTCRQLAEVCLAVFDGIFCACRRLGRKPTILIAGGCFITGITLCAAAVQIAMLIIGRIMIGLGVGFGNQVGQLEKG